MLYQPSQLQILKEPFFNKLKELFNYYQTKNILLKKYIKLVINIIFNIAILKTNKLIKLQIAMSIYSGFATRNLQQTYDQCVCDLLFVLQKRIIKFYQNVQADQDKFFAILSQLYHQIVHLEKSKYLEPKSSIFINEIYDYLKQKKQQRNQCPQQQLKKFQKSQALKSKHQEILLKNDIKINNLIERSALSFGKIKKQIQSGGKFMINYSNHSSKEKQSNNFSLEKYFENPQEKLRNKPKRLFSSNGIRNPIYSIKKEQLQTQNSNEAKINISKGKGGTAEQVVKQYLQKTNKNYLRGYRKRRIRQEFSSANEIPRSLPKDKKMVY